MSGSPLQASLASSELEACSSNHERSGAAITPWIGHMEIAVRQGLGSLKTSGIHWASMALPGLDDVTRLEQRLARAEVLLRRLLLLFPGTHPHVLISLLGTAPTCSAFHVARERTVDERGIAHHPVGRLGMISCRDSRYCSSCVCLRLTAIDCRPGGAGSCPP